MALSKLDYVERTTDAACTATAEASADIVLTANPVTVDGSTQIAIRFGISGFEVSNGTAIGILWLYQDDGSTNASIGRIWDSRGVAAATPTTGFTVERRLTPAADTYTYSVRGTINTGGQTLTLKAGAGGTGTRMPMALLIISEG